MSFRTTLGFSLFTTLGLWANSSSVRAVLTTQIQRSPLSPPPLSLQVPGYPSQMGSFRVWERYHSLAENWRDNLTNTDRDLYEDSKRLIAFLIGARKSKYTIHPNTYRGIVANYVSILEKNFSTQSSGREHPLVNTAKSYFDEIDKNTPDLSEGAERYSLLLRQYADELANLPYFRNEIPRLKSLADQYSAWGKKIKDKKYASQHLERADFNQMMSEYSEFLKRSICPNEEVAYQLNEEVEEISDNLKNFDTRLTPASCRVQNLDSNSSNDEFIPDGKPLTRYYTINYNTRPGPYSDHAPMIFGKTMTWNIALQGDYVRLGGFYNHKFINLKKESQEQYHRRLSLIAEAIGQSIEREGLNQVLLQEMPNPGSKSSAYFASELAKHGLILKRYKSGEMGLVVSKKNEAMRLMKTDDRKFLNRINYIFKFIKNKNSAQSLNRMDSFWNPKEKVIYVSVHTKWGIGGKEVCRILKEKGDDLLRQAPEAKSVRFIGDFNHSASQIQHDCALLGISKIHSTPGESSYSAGADGKNNDKNIDLMVEMFR